MNFDENYIWRFGSGFLIYICRFCLVKGKVFIYNIHRTGFAGIPLPLLKWNALNPTADLQLSQNTGVGSVNAA